MIVYRAMSLKEFDNFTNDKPMASEDYTGLFVSADSNKFHFAKDMNDLCLLTMHDSYDLICKFDIPEKDFIQEKVTVSTLVHGGSTRINNEVTEYSLDCYNLDNAMFLDGALCINAITNPDFDIVRNIKEQFDLAMDSPDFTVPDNLNDLYEKYKEQGSEALCFKEILDATGFDVASWAQKNSLAFGRKDDDFEKYKSIAEYAESADYIFSLGSNLYNEYLETTKEIQFSNMDREGSFFFEDDEIEIKPPKISEEYTIESEKKKETLDDIIAALTVEKDEDTNIFKEWKDVIFDKYKCDSTDQISLNDIISSAQNQYTEVSSDVGMQIAFEI